MQLKKSIAGNTATTKPLPVTFANTPLEHKCLEYGLRITVAKRCILEVLEKAEGHMTAEEVYRHLLKSHSGVSISTIYSNIRGLVKAGVIEQRKFQSKQSYYSATHSAPYDQLIDIESGRVIEFRNETLDKLKADIGRKYGFNMTECRVEFYAHACNKQAFNTKT